MNPNFQFQITLGIIREDLVPIVNPWVRNTMLVQHMSSKIISPLDSLSSDTHTPFNRTVHTVAIMHRAVMPTEALLCLEGSRPRTIRGLTGKSPGGASMRATMGVAGTC